jgi:hypothetical protein
MEISDAQFGTLEQAARRAFHADLLARLKARLVPQLVNIAHESTLLKMDEWHQRAVRYGMTSRRAIGRFLGIQLTVLPDFDLSEKVLPLLTEQSLTGDNKMTLIFDRLKRR